MSKAIPWLSPAQIELLALLSEELGEAQQAIGKVLRHGFESYNPEDDNGQSNRDQLEKELGDVGGAITLLVASGELKGNEIERYRKLKLERVRGWLHHQADRN